MPLERPLRRGPFAITPEGEPGQIQEQLRELQDGEALATASGFADLALLTGQPTTVPEAYRAFWQPVRSLELLLSFAHRCRIQFIEPTFRVEQEGRWAPSGWHS